MDVVLQHTDDGAEITIENGIMAMDDGVATAAYMSLFGGALEDSGLAGDDARQFWGNLISADKSEQLRSETQNLLRSLPATSQNLKRIQDAVGRDLAWMADELGAVIDVTTTIPGYNRVAIAGSITIDGRKFPISFSKPWNSSQ